MPDGFVIRGSNFASSPDFAIRTISPPSQEGVPKEESASTQTTESILEQARNNPGAALA
jgi:hypothetical protein